MRPTVTRVLGKREVSHALVFLIMAPVFFLNRGSIPLPSQFAVIAEDPAHFSYLPLVLNKSQTWSDCSTSRLGAVMTSEQSSGETTADELVQLNQDGYTGLVGAQTYELAGDNFPLLAGWQRVQVCNSHDCLRQRAQRAAEEGLPYEYLGYGPERLDGVPPEEKFNLPWATQVAREIADEWNKKLVIGYSTKQLHQEAEERGYDWNDPSEVIALLAPYGDIWMIQAADEFWRLEDGTVRPILSQRVYPPGPEFRAEVGRWVNWVKAANPDIEIWIQLGVQRIGIPGENEPSSDLLLEYREWIVDLVDGVYIMPIYGSVDQLPLANQEMVAAFHKACTAQNGGAVKVFSPAKALNGGITLVEAGWTDDLEIPCTPNGECLTLIPGFYYRVYENTNYPCGAQGYHQFMVLDRGPDTSAPKYLFAKFLGGGVGFWYLDGENEPTYYPNETATGILRASQNWLMFFRTSVSEEHANGVTRKFRENNSFRLMVASYCSHDLYHGQGEYTAIDGFSRWGYSAAKGAVEYVRQNFNTPGIITYGGSSGAAGSFFVGKNQAGVLGIVMDSQAVDLSAISKACNDDGISVFGSSYPCFCPEGGPSCMEVLAPRIGFTLGSDEPHQFIKAGFGKPIYYVWNERDASIYAPLQFENLHNAIEEYNPGGRSIANRVCIDDPRSPPGPTCNLHVPSSYDFPDTKELVEEIYHWGTSLIVDDYPYKVKLPIVIR